MPTLRQALEHIKTAATRQVKEVQKLVDAGRIDEAKAMAAKLEAAGVLKKSTPGTTLKRLGAGREGIADLVLGAKDAPTGHEIAVRKAYDPKTSLFNPKFPDRKVQIGRELGSDPYFAQMFTPDKAHMAGNVPYHISEHIQGQALGETDIKQHMGKVYEAQWRGNEAARKVLGTFGHMDDIVDPLANTVHWDNTRITPSGSAKVIDYLPIGPNDHRGTRFPNITDESRALEREMIAHLRAGRNQEADAIASQLNAQPANIHEGFRQLGGSRQPKKVRYAPPPPVTPATPLPSVTPSIPPSSAHVPPTGGAAPYSLKPEMSPGLRARFSNLSTAGKAGVVGGAALGAGLLGYGAYRMLRRPQENPNGSVPIQNRPQT